MPYKRALLVLQLLLYWRFMEFSCFLYKQPGSEASIKRWKVKPRGWPVKPSAAHSSTHKTEKTLHSNDTKVVLRWKFRANVAVIWTSSFLTAPPENVSELKLICPEAEMKRRDKRVAAFSCSETLGVCLPPRQERWSWRRWRLWTHLPRRSWAVEKDIPSELCLVLMKSCTVYCTVLIFF